MRFAPLALLIATAHAFQQPLRPLKPGALGKKPGRLLAAAAGEQKQTGASVPATTLGVAKNLIGAGTFAMPAAMSRTMAPGASLAGGLAAPLAMMVALASMSAYCFNMIGRATNGERATLGEAWEAAGLGSTSWLIKGGTVLRCASACLMYGIVLADLGVPLVASAVPALATRARVLAATMAVAAPLCLAPTLDYLKPFSLAGLASTLLVVAFMGLRCFTPDRVAAPRRRGRRGGLGRRSSCCRRWRRRRWRTTTRPLRAELADPQGPTANRRFARAVAGAFALTTLVNGLVAALGVATFGTGRPDIPGFVLNAYGSATSKVVDTLADAARAVFFFSFLTSFPFAFAGLKDGVTPGAWTPPAKKALTLGMLGGLGVAAHYVTDAGFVVAFAGATLGSALTYVIPSLLLLKTKGDALSKLEKGACKLITAAGFAFMSLGGFITAKSYF
ncbi:hypothetical protein JL721_8913 [Aureococcus anophagefferens]|nr:hypothetical protein JL721_8913 [Aureococcus anophagefferens]